MQAMYLCCSWLFFALLANIIPHGVSMSVSTRDNAPIIISRHDWGARDSRSKSYLTDKQPLPFVYIHHSGTGQCFGQSECISKIRGFQNYHMDDNGWADIGYSFLIGGDGSIYEGRGWDRVGAHTLGHNTDGLGFCLIGNFQTASPSTPQIEAVKQMIAYGVSLGKISSNYAALGHRDVVATTCPGKNLYALIQAWPHYGRQDPVVG